jgi:hypothetical protein
VAELDVLNGQRMEGSRQGPVSARGVRLASAHSGLVQREAEQSSVLTGLRGKRMIAPVDRPGLRVVLRNARRARSDQTRRLKSLRATTGQLADLLELAVRIADARSIRRSPGESPTLTVRHLNLTQRLVAKPLI